MLPKGVGTTVANRALVLRMEVGRSWVSDDGKEGFGSKDASRQTFGDVVEADDSGTSDSNPEKNAPGEVQW